MRSCCNRSGWKFLHVKCSTVSRVYRAFYADNISWKKNLETIYSCASLLSLWYYCFPLISTKRRLEKEVERIESVNGRRKVLILSSPGHYNIQFSIVSPAPLAIMFPPAATPTSVFTLFMLGSQAYLLIQDVFGELYRFILPFSCLSTQYK